MRETGIDPRKIAAQEKWNLAAAKRQLVKKGEWSKPRAVSKRT